MYAAAMRGVPPINSASTGGGACFGDPDFAINDCNMEIGGLEEQFCLDCDPAANWVTDAFNSKGWTCNMNAVPPKLVKRSIAGLYADAWGNCGVG